MDFHHARRVFGLARHLMQDNSYANTHRSRLLAHGSCLHDHPCLSLPNHCVPRGDSVIRAHGFKTRGIRGQRSVEQNLELVLLRHSKLFLIWREHYSLLQGAYLCTVVSVPLTHFDCSMWSLRKQISSRSPQTIGSLASHCTQLASWGLLCHSRRVTSNNNLAYSAGCI